MATSAGVFEPPQYPAEIRRIDLSPYRESNTGVPYVHSFDSGRPGLHVMVNALTHGNEWCGMHVVCRLLDAGLRPRTGRLTLSLANVAACEAGGADGTGSRFVDRDFNRLWHDDLLTADTQSVEARRAHALRPIVATVDRLLDLHSTWHALQPFFVLSQLPRVRALADTLAIPPRQLFLPDVWHEGYHLIDYGAFRRPEASAVGLIAECGQHFAQSSVDTAWRVTVRFLQVHGLMVPEPGAPAPGPLPAPAALEHYEIAVPVIARTDALRLTCSYAGFVRFSEGEVAAFDGDTPVLAPFDGAVLLAPRPAPKAGQQAFSWGRRVPPLPPRPGA
ncbi:MAG: succinylglutamate desuccinylase/aspartoacylase family protein [Rhodoferax sp.]|jgi:predicted deacylase|nr:succinylglutamate desuccinylase/aspartoacylase family protein [Rhodoferax sp.]